MDFDQLQLLLKRYNEGTASEQEKELLEDWYEQLGPETPEWDDAHLDLVKRDIYAELQTRIGKEENPGLSAQVALVQRMFPILKWAAALLIIALGTWFYLSQRSDKTELVKQSPVTPGIEKIVPGGNAATLTLASGKMISLREMQNGKITDEESSTIIKTADGQISYEVHGRNDSSTIAAYNSLITPRGGTWLLMLPDATKVWLNAGSSIRYPVAFKGKERKVELNGEAYFEVAKNAHMPFRVISSRQSIEVLGTHFNIHAYPDEPIVQTTLLEGSIRITSSLNGSSKQLIPGDQASFRQDGTLWIEQVNTKATIAWKNGFFHFHEAGIQTVMQEISRWYNVDIRYATAPGTELFNGDIPKNAELANVFKILALNGIHCSVEGRTIIVE